MVGSRRRIALACVAACELVAALTGSTASAVVVERGYRLLGADGGVYAFGASFGGSPAPSPGTCAPNTLDRSLPDGTCLAMAATPDGRGYWIMNASSGLVLSFGSATRYGDPSAGFATTPREFVPAFRSIASTQDGKGYWILEEGAIEGGTVAHFGDAASFGDTATIARNTGAEFAGRPVAIAGTSDGKGYWEVHSDGGVFAFGDAKFYGSASQLALAQPVVGIAPAADGNGYWLAAADGGVFAFGSARYAGSAAGLGLQARVVDIARNPVGSGYWLAAADGGVFAFGGAPYLGSMSGRAHNAPVYAIAAATGS